MNSRLNCARNCDVFGGWVPGRINNKGEHFPRTGILPEIIDGKGHLGGKGSHVIESKEGFPQVGTLPGRI